jgi:N-hydroxyarylamine O-acetyltransferase
MNDKAASSAFFTENLLVARSEKGRRLAVWNVRLNAHTLGAPTEARVMTSVGELRDTLSGPMGIALPADERLGAALQKIVDRGPD